MGNMGKILVLMLWAVCAAQTAAISDAQLEQLQKLTPAQQQALARQYGVTLGAAGKKEPQAVDKEPPQPSIQPRAVKLKPDERGLLPFGYGLFAGQPLSLAPLDDLPVPDNYVLGPGDEIEVRIYGKKEANYQLVINREGSIDLPELGPFNARGLTYQQLKQELSDLIKRRMIGVDVTVSLGRLKTMQVFVLGEAHAPGSYVVSSLSTVTQALKAAGGVAKLGSLRDIQVKRNNQIIKRIDLYDLLITGNTRSNISLQQGDVVFIPVKKKTVAVHGLVKRPAIYELLDDTAIDRVIALAGGLGIGASSLVKVERLNRNGRKVFEIDLQSRADRNRFALQNGDEISVAKLTDFYRQAIQLTGAVAQPGAYPWRQGMTVSDILHSVELHLNKDADLKSALIVREIGHEYQIKVIHFNLFAAMSNRKSGVDILLQPRDQILILNKDTGIAEKHGKHGQLSIQIDDKEVRDKLEISGLDDKSRQVSSAENLRAKLLKPIIAQLKAQAGFDSAVQIVDIRGAVKYPGVYPLFENADLKTLLELAGGLNEASYLQGAELARFVESDSESALEYQTLDIAAVMRGEPQANIRLHSKDRLHIFTRPEWREDLQITLTGEVRFPGTYNFNRGETLRQVIQRAGGLTRFAYPQGAVFARESLRKIELQQLDFLHKQLKAEVSGLAFRRQNTMSPLQSHDMQSALDTVEQLGSVEAMGRMSINLERILAQDSAGDINLEHQDSLHIPPLRQVISVFGHVQFPASHVYDARKTVDDYIEFSGGPKKQADADRVYVIRANGSVFLPNRSYWFNRDKGRLLPGDTIIMPLDTDYLDGLTAWTSATQIMYQLGVAWSAISD